MMDLWSSPSSAPTARHPSAQAIGLGMTEETTGGLKGRDWGWPDVPRYRAPLGRMNVMTGDPARWAGLRDDGPLVRNASPLTGDPTRWAGLRDDGPLGRNRLRQ